MAARSRAASTSASRWELRTAVCPRPQASATARRNSRSINGSGPLVGSSRIRTAAPAANPATSATFFRLPVEKARPSGERETVDQLAAVLTIDARASVAVEDQFPAGGRPGQTEQQPDGTGLGRAVRPKETRHLAGRPAEVEAVTAAARREARCRRSGYRLHMV